MDVRARLAEYRKEKSPTEGAPSKETSVSSQEQSSSQEQRDDVGHQEGCKQNSSQEYGEQQLEDSNQHRDCQEHENNYRSSWLLTCLKVVLWLLVWGFFIEVEFGVVYLFVSGLVFMIATLQGNRKKRVAGELSAYSVFNKNCEAIEGTLSAEQFERELRYGPSSVR